MVGNEGMAGLGLCWSKHLLNTGNSAGGGLSDANASSSRATRRKSAWTFSSTSASILSLSTVPGFSILRVQSLSFGNDRLARWLLITIDRLGTDEFRLEFMSNMLGVRREGVNQAAGSLQTAKLIRYSRGMIKILNRQRLQVSACKCYSIIRAESDQYLN